MAYKRLEFKNRSVERPRTYSVTENPDGSITLRDSFGQTYVEGTPLDAANMNYLEDGIAACGLTKYAATTTYDKNELVVDGATGKIYVSQVGNNKGTPLTNTSYWKLLVIGTLETARKINGTDFDGSKDITTSTWGTARNISISNSDGTGAGTATSVNGSAAVTLKLPSTIKATLNGNVTGNVTGNCSGSSSSCTGNSATATKATQDSDGIQINTNYSKKRGEISGARNWNDYKDYGCYKVQNTTMTAEYNAPVGEYNYGLLVVEMSNIAHENRTIQIYYPHNVTISRIWTRMLNGTSWTGWVAMLSTTGNAASATKATQDGSGRNIVNTYATKAELETARPIIEYY